MREGGKENRVGKILKSFLESGLMNLHYSFEIISY